MYLKNIYPPNQVNHLFSNKVIRREELYATLLLPVEEARRISTKRKEVWLNKTGAAYDWKSAPGCPREQYV